MMKKPVRPNIFWLISDDTSADMLGFGGGRALSPHIDEIAARGVVFQNFHCISPACAPSRYNCLTGRYGGRCPAVTEGVPHGEPYSVFFNTSLDPARETTLPGLLQQAGYHTGHVGKWHVAGSPADVAAIPKLEAGEDPRDPAVSARMALQQEHICAIVRRAGFSEARSVVWGNHELAPKAAKTHNLEWTTKGALDFLDSASRTGKPFFLSMATNTIHGPNHISSMLSDPRVTVGGMHEEQIGCQASRASVYERIAKAGGVPFNSTTAGVLWMDDALGAVLGRIRALGLEDNTVVIISSDHGPSRGGKFSLYEAGLRIPFVVAGKDRFAGGRTAGDLAQTTDFAATVLDLAGIVAPEKSMDGRSLLPILEGGSLPEPENGLFSEFGHARAVRCGKWKYIAWRPPQRLLEDWAHNSRIPMHYGKSIPSDVVRPALQTPTLHNYPHYFDADQLYDLDADPDETRNLAADPACAGALKEVREKLRAHLDALGHLFPLDAPDPFFGSTDHERMKAAAREKTAKEFPLWEEDARFIGFLP